MKKSSAKNVQMKMPESAASRLTNLTSCIEYLEKAGRLVRVKSSVSSKYELAGIAKKYEGQKCILFGCGRQFLWQSCQIPRGAWPCSYTPAALVSAGLPGWGMRVQL